LPPALQLKKLKLHYFSVNLVTATIIILFLTGVPPGDLISNRSHLLQRWQKIEIINKLTLKLSKKSFF